MNAAGQVEPTGVAAARRAPLPPAKVGPGGATAAAAPRGWRAALAAGVYPPLLLGFLASALANRLAFAGWGLVAAVGHAALLRAAWSRGWSVAARAALTLAWTAVATFSFAGLVERHGEILDLGYRAVLWPVYLEALTRPATWHGVAAAGAVLAALAGVAVVRRRGRSPS